MHDESLYAERALRAGANGYIMKQEATERVLEAIRRIRGGEVYVSDRIAKRLLRQIVSSPAAGKSPMEALTDRELAVFRLIGKGRGTREIADDLHVSVKTVESYQAHIKEKLSLKNARELVQHAFQWVTSEERGAVDLRAKLHTQGIPDAHSRSSPRPETSRRPIERRSAITLYSRRLVTRRGGE